MECQFVCVECGCAHDEPADAGLGHLVTCLDCAMSIEHASVAIAIDIETKPLAA